MLLGSADNVTGIFSEE